MTYVPTIEDVRKAGEQAKAAVASAFEQARTPLLAALGAGEVTTKAVIDAVTKARAQFTESAEQARSTAGDLPTELTNLRERLDPAELRKLVDQYSESANKLYSYLAEEGEKALDRLRAQPQFKRAVEQFDQAVEAAQQRAEAAVEDARELADDVLGRVVRRTRSAGERAAEVTETATEDVADTVEQAGAEAADQVRGTTRKATDSASNAAAKTTTTRRTSTGTTRPTTRKPTGE